MYLKEELIQALQEKKEEVNFGYKNLKFIWELQSCMALTGHALKGGKQLHQGTRY